MFLLVYEGIRPVILINDNEMVDVTIGVRLEGIKIYYVNFSVSILIWVEDCSIRTNLGVG